MENITLNVGDIKAILETKVGEIIKSSITTNRIAIEKSITDYFTKGFLNNKESNFDHALDWAVEAIFREEVKRAIDDLGFKEMVYEKAKELMSEDGFIRELAEKKVKASLGLI